MQHTNDIPRSSAILKEPKGEKFLEWSNDAFAIISGVLYIIHPSQYTMGRQIHAQLLSKDLCKETVESWPSVFTALSVITNRSTPYHRDDQGNWSWYDMLTSIGPYDVAPLYVSPFRFRIDNVPGSLCAFSGMGLRHGVRECDRPRISFAWYMRENVRVGAGIPSASWMTQSCYTSRVGTTKYGLRDVCLLD